MAGAIALCQWMSGVPVHVLGAPHVRTMRDGCVDLPSEVVDRPTISCGRRIPEGGRQDEYGPIRWSGLVSTSTRPWVDT